MECPAILSGSARAGFKPPQAGHLGTVSPTPSLIFDDRPNPAGTPQIAEQLKRCHATATFLKYAATLAALPKRSCGTCLEVGCSTGAFTGLLAARCEHVVAIDFSLGALQLARRHLEGVRNVDLLRASFPEETPPGSWDAIVCSEVLHHLPEQALDEAIGWIKTQLGCGASVLAVSSRGVGNEEPLLGEEVHDRLALQFARWHALDARQDGYRLDRFDGQ